MLNDKLYSQNQLLDYSSLFSRSEVLSWLKNDFSSINYKIERYDTNWIKSNSSNYIDYLKYVYRILESHYQNEYIFKNAFINEFAIKEMNHCDTSIFNEFRVGDSVADIAMFNGSSKVFEVKTSYDSTRRLSLQLENYNKAFNQVYVIIPESKIELYKNYDDNTGLIVFNSNSESKFEVEREADPNKEVDPKVIMRILRSNEYKEVVKEYYSFLPKMTSFNQFNECERLICEIPVEELNILFIQQMKKRNSNHGISRRYYKEFNQISLALKFSKDDRKKMIEKLKSPIQI